MRIDLKTKQTSREKNELKKKWGTKYSVEDDKVILSDSIDVPERMMVVFKTNPFERWLCLTPKEWNKAMGFFVAIPVTIERTKQDPFEYQFVLDRVTQIALCSQPRSIKLSPPYLALGKLSRTDHVQISKIISKIIFDPSIGDIL
jgi:hypothetical protein